MKNARFIFTLITFIYGVVHKAEAGTLQLEGLVVDSETNQELPFAHIAYGKTGTVTNNEGQFVLKIPENSSQSRLIVSSMGYQSRYVNIYDIMNMKCTIKLDPSVIQLDEVSVYSAEKIIKDINNHRQINYEYEDLLLSTFYKESIYAENDLCYLAEGVLDVYLPTIYSAETPRVEAKKARKKVFVSMDSIKAPAISGHARDMLEGTMRRKHSFLEMKEIKNYEFQKSGFIQFQGRDVYKISFRPTNAKGTAKGTIFVDEETSALVRTEYYPVVSNQKFWSEVKWVEEYTEIDGSWYLRYVSYDGKWIEDGKAYEFNALLLITDFKPVEVPPSMNITLEDEAVFFDEASESSELFWEDYNFIKMTLEEKSE